MAGRFPARNIGRAAPELHASLACSSASSDVQWVQGSRTNTTSAYEVFKRSIASPGPRTSTLTPPIAPGHAVPGSVEAWLEMQSRFITLILKTSDSHV